MVGGNLYTFLIIVTDFKEHPKLHNLASLLKTISDDRGVGVVFASFSSKNYFCAQKNISWIYFFQ